MDWKVVFSEASRQDLFDITSYIARDDPAAAQRFGNALIDRATALAVAPKMGIVYQRDGKARYVIHRSFLVIYDINPEREEIVILRFWHGARGTRPRFK